jgi:large subunit ribosomal protein L9
MRRNLQKVLEISKLSVGAKVGESGKIFGAVTTLQIADQLAEKGFQVDRKQIAFPVQPKEVGEYVALARSS